MKRLSALAAAMMLSACVTSQPEQARDQCSIDSGLYSLTETVSLRELADCQTVKLTSGGGNVAQWTAIADTIRRNNLAVQVDRYCTSACVLAMVASDRITVAAGAYIAIHRPSVERNMCLNSRAGRVCQTMRHSSSYDVIAYSQALREKGLPEETIQTMSGTPDLVRLVPSDLKAMGVSVNTRR